MSTKKIQILNSTVKQAQNADTLDGLHADEFSTANDLANKQDKHKTATLTLSTSGWSSQAQTVSVSDISATDTIVVSPSPEHIAAYSEAGVYCSAQAANSLTFTCDSTPSADISVNVIVFA